MTISTRMNTDMVLDALEQALHDRGMPKNVIHHSDRGVQYLSIRYTNRLEAANLRASVGTTGDSYDNALAETVNGLYKTEVIEYLKADMSDGEEYIYVCDEYTGIVKVIRKVLGFYVGYIEDSGGYDVHKELLDEETLREYVKDTW